jgi:hypothetical protein
VIVVGGSRNHNGLKCETAMKADKFLLLAHGTANEVNGAKNIIQNTHPAELSLHDLKAENQSRKVT